MKVNLLKLKDEDPAAYGLTRASLIQKLIRRSMMPEALWVTKLFVDDNHSKGLRRRILQIAAEDIGLACPKLINYLHQEPDLFKCVATMCLCSKNREVDQFLLNVAYRKEEYQQADSQVQKEIDVLEHLLTLSEQWFTNKRLKAGLINFQEAVKYLATFNLPYQATIELAGELYIELSRANVHGARVMLALIALLATRKIEDTPVPTIQMLPPIKELTEVPDYALDMHTPAGRQMNRSFEHWVQEGAVVSPHKQYPQMFDSRGEEKYPLMPLVPYLKKLK